MIEGARELAEKIHKRAVYFYSSADYSNPAERGTVIDVGASEISAFAASGVARERERIMEAAVLANWGKQDEIKCMIWREDYE